MKAGYIFFKSLKKGKKNRTMFNENRKKNKINIKRLLFAFIKFYTLPIM